MTLENNVLIDFIIENEFQPSENNPSEYIPLISTLEFSYGPLQIIINEFALFITLFNEKITSCYIGISSIDKGYCAISWRVWNIIKTKRTKEFSREIPYEIKLDVFFRDKGHCVYCGSKENIEYDHIYPYSRGGTHHLHNIQLLCKKCNREKSDKIIQRPGQFWII